MSIRVAVVIPAFNEGDHILPVLDRITEGVTLSAEIVVVMDSLDDTTWPVVEAYAATNNRVRPLLNTLGRGPGNAIHAGLMATTAPVAVVTMADGCDDAMQIDTLTRLVERGTVVASASRYARSGQQVGGPFLKGTMSKFAGLSLFYLARVGTRDATNSFKAYSTEFVRAVGIESDGGFEIGLELVAKARRYRLPVAEIPTIWLDRAFGVSNFQLTKWLPRYLHWYRFAFGRKLTLSAPLQHPIHVTGDSPL